MSEERAKYWKIYKDYMQNEEAPCPYCGHGVGYADLHHDDCFMLDIIAYIDNDIPLPIAAAPAVSAAQDDSGYTELIDTLAARINGLERELAQVRAALLECTVQMNKHGNDDNWETVTMAYAQAIKDGREVLEAE